MAGITLEKGKVIYTDGQPLTALHLLTGGKIQVSYPGGTYQLVKGDVVGICEICSEVHFLTYTALEDTELITYALPNMDSLDDILQKHPDVARLFLLSMFRQINALQNYSSISEMNCGNLYQSVNEDYEKYNTLCNRYRLSQRTLDNHEKLTAYLIEETPDLWVNSYYLGLAHIYSSDNYKYFIQEPSVSIGMLRKGSLDYRKTYLSLEEQFRYQKKLFHFYFNESGNDLFSFFTSVYYKLDPNSDDAQSVLADVNRMLQQGKESICVDRQLLDNYIRSFRNKLTPAEESAPVQKETVADPAIMAELTDSLNVILDFAQIEPETAASFRKHVNYYKALEDRTSTDDKCALLRKKLTQEFYVIYSKAFEQTLETLSVPMPVQMFLHFGYVDEELAGASNATTLYSLTKSLADYSSSGLYTFYNWLHAIYNGKKEPSRNEFEQDFTDYIHKLKSGKQFTETEIRAMEKDPMCKIRYELENMFPQVNKMTFGRVTTFCPLFSSDNVLKDLEASVVTLSKICKAIEQVKKVDYTAFFRESLDMDHINIMGKEPIHLEYLPDIILMPNVGIRGVMWQEIEGKKRNSPGRMFFSIFHMEDINTSFIRLVGEFRWELCKRVQGARWNDLSEPSLTSEYFDYIQFYRKNHDLTVEAKERVRTSLQRAKNSFKEMFVRDYLVWVLFEGTGSPRLNKVARSILFKYCPFPADICNTLEQNPLYSEILHYRKVKMSQKLHHLDKLRKKILSCGTPLPPTLEAEFSYVDGTLQ